ncbi:piggyBac transposable element-derived protein 4-like [Dreissena polymorpha]|uniref:piggyBac transposable element-derived protein 4-like n=1 Tax=Dreissena polymorpha TaxID=45954 RepID=UPI00226468A1|nr:piggyBac transposable element-derived protein 4-like [Dreissena polymorpha]
MPAKPIKCGIKCWMHCDSRSGYLANFEVYLGRDRNNVEHGLAYNVVMRLARFIRNTFRWVFFNNFFTGLPLVKSLLQNGLYSCGTVRCNRKGFPQQLKKPAALRQRGDSQVLQLGDSNITVSVWMDRKPVHHLSSLSDPTEICDATRRSGQNILHLQQPHSVAAYNRSMGGVDLHDQLRAKYPSGRNSKKWWRYLFWFLLDSAIVNSYVLYKEWSTRETMKRRYTHLDLRRELLKELIGSYRKRKHSDRDDAVDRPALMPVENIVGPRNVRLNAKRTTCKYHKTRVGHRSDTV